VTRAASFTVCDEVAQGGLGKLAYLGIYSGEIIVPHLPFTLPQLFFVVRLRSQIDDPPQRFVVRIERPGMEPFTLDQSGAALPTTLPPVGATYFDAQAIIRIAPFEIQTEGTVKVFVEDESEDNYAGGIRLKMGVHPEIRLPQVAGASTVVVGHYNRLKDVPVALRQQTAAELVEALSSFISYSGLPTMLQFPEADVRLLLDNERMHVLFPRPRDDDAYNVEIEPTATFDSWKIEEANRIGFIVKFEPSAPADALINYKIVERPKKIARTQDGAFRSKKAKSRKTRTK
jgi:hypothetical protein